MQTTVPLPTAEYQRLKGIEKEFDQMKDMPWSDVVPKGFHYIKVNQDMKYSALEIKHEALDLRYNQLRKDNIRLSRDYDDAINAFKKYEVDALNKFVEYEKNNCEFTVQYQSLESRNNQLRKENIGLRTEFDKQASLSSISEHAVKGLKIQMGLRLAEIEDYKKTIKSFESDKAEYKSKSTHSNLLIIALVAVLIAWQIFYIFK